jgi:hypothetical protein
VLLYAAAVEALGMQPVVYAGKEFDQASPHISGGDTDYGWARLGLGRRTGELAFGLAGPALVLDFRQRRPSLRQMNSAVAGLELEEQLERFRAAFRMDAEPAALLRRGPLPQVQIRDPQRPEQRQKQVRVVAAVVERIRPRFLVIALERGLGLRQNPSISGGRNEL